LLAVAEEEEEEEGGGFAATAPAANAVAVKGPMAMEVVVEKGACVPKGETRRFGLPTK
jgi:hypothetical protein